MNGDLLSTGCACCPMNRRRFLARGGAAAATALGMFSAPNWLDAAPAKAKPRIRIIYALHGEKQEGPDWPNKGFDFGPHMQRINQALTKRCRGFEFVTSLANGEEQAKAILATDTAASNIDGYLVYQMNCWNRVVQTMATSGKPVLYADFQFGGSGGFLVYTAAFLRAKTANVGFVASSDLDDLVAAVKCFEVVNRGGSPADFVAATDRVRVKETPKAGRLACSRDEVKCLSANDCLRRFKESKILAVRGQEPVPASESMGIKVQYLPFSELNDAWKNVDFRC